jgi:hypothetical protein
VVPIMISLKESCCIQGFLVFKIWSHHFDRCTIVPVTGLIVTEYLCHKWSLICSVCGNPNPILY